MCRARLGAIELLAQFIHPAQNVLRLGARHQVAALVGQILAEVLHAGPHGSARPSRGAAQAAEFSRADKADLDRVSSALSSVRTMQGHFVQIGPDGHIDEGAVYIKKPGEMRFEYAAPSPTLIVCDGLDIAVFNTQLHTIDRYPLSVTPLYILLSDHVDLSLNSAVTRV